MKGIFTLASVLVLMLFLGATQAKDVYITVKKGDNLSKLAHTYGVPASRIAQGNGLKSPDDIRFGMTLRIPSNTINSTSSDRSKKSGSRASVQQKYQLQAKYQKYLALLNRQHRIRAYRYAQQAKYEKYLVIKANNQRILAARYAKQVKYEKYLALINRQHRIMQIRYDQQTKYDKFLAWQRQQRLLANGSRVRHVSFGGSARMSFPLRDFRLTDSYGPRDFSINGDHFHAGIDLAAPVGTPVYAASSGTITSSGWGMYGKGVFVDSGNTRVIYGHLSRTAVNEGDTVSRGDVLGYVGCTGICTGPHLHFEIHVDGQHVDPRPYLP